MKSRSHPSSDAKVVSLWLRVNGMAKGRKMSLLLREEFFCLDHFGMEVFRSTSLDDIEAFLRKDRQWEKARNSIPEGL